VVAFKTHFCTTLRLKLDLYVRAYKPCLIGAVQQVLSEVLIRFVLEVPRLGNYEASARRTLSIYNVTLI
jgi:hypothetical protein